ncbi:MAG: hypothetical protein HYT79_00130 [Elusimicrobia bacterium]|nr:hypothetical protein [Elusimicrobiota bacterium]
MPPSENAIIHPWIRRLRAKRAVYLTCLFLGEALVLGSLLLSAALLIDGFWGAPALWRDALRWVLIAGTAGRAAWIFFKRRDDFFLPRVLEAAEARLEFQGDPLRNAWSFSRPSASAPQSASDFQRLLRRREIERAGDLLRRGGIAGAFGFREFFREFGRRRAAAVLAPVAAAVVLALLTGGGPGRYFLRIFNPYREITLISKKISFDPAPGTYQRPWGSAVSVRLGFDGEFPRRWGAPVIMVNGETQRMVPIESSVRSTAYLYTIVGLQETVRLSVHWGEYRAGGWVFEPVSPPQVRSLSVGVSPPAYTGLKPARHDNPSFLQALAGSRLSWSLEADQELEEAQLMLETEGSAPRALGRFPADKSRLSFDHQPAGGGRLMLSLRDRRGLVNPEAWVLSLELAEDAPPEVSIIEPVFPEVYMDEAEELAVSWQAKDDVRLSEVAGVVRGVSPPSGDARRVIWKENAKQSAQAQGLFVFRPKAWKLKPGDQAILYFEAKDNNPGSDPARSREALLITIQDFARQHKANLEEKSAAMKEKFMDHLEKGLDVAAKLAEASSATFTADLERLMNYSQASGELSRTMENYADELGKDPLASPKWAWGLRQVARQLKIARSAHLENAAGELINRNEAAANERFSRYMEELEKASSAFDELKKEEKMSDALASAQRLEHMADRLSRSLENPQDLKELEEALKDLDREFQELAQALSKLPAEEFPQEFINQIQKEDMPLAQVADARSRLEEALRRGDIKAALDAARQMAANLKKLREEVSEAAQAHRSKPQQMLSGSGEGQEKQPAILDDLKKIRERQEELLWKTSGVERSVKGRREKAPSEAQALNDEESKILRGLSGDQKNTAAATNNLLQKLSEIDREYPSLVLGSQVTQLESAWQDQLNAQQSLDRPHLPGALESESAALKKLTQVENELAELARQMESQSGGSAQGEGGRRSVMVVPSGSGFGQEQGGLDGFRFGRVAIPKPDDYRVPSQGRKEIMRSLQEKRPKDLDDEIGEYLRNLLK